MSQINTDKFIKLVYKYHPNTIFVKDPQNNIMLVPAENVKNIIGSETWLPCAVISPNCSFTRVKFQGSSYCYVDDLITFIQDSIEEKTLGCLHNDTNGCTKRILWRNAHFVIDYHKPLGVYDSSKYSDQVNIMVDLIENVLSKYNLRGECEYEMSRCTDTRFRVDYFINLPTPIIIEIDEKHHGEYRERLNDNEKNKLNNLGFNIVRIDAILWKNNKGYYRNVLNKTVKKYTGLLFVNNIKKKIDELGLKESFRDFGIDNYSTMIQDDFVFPLSKVLEKFGIEKDEDIHSQIMKRFMLLDNGNDDVDYDDYEDSDLELDADGLDSDEENEEDEEDDEENNESDEEDNDDNEDNDDKDNDNNDDNDNGNNNSKNKTKVSAVTSWAPGVHYAYNNDEDEYYLKYPTVVAVATIAGTWMGQNYIDKTWELICYINDNVDKARENIVNLMTIDELTRKKMFNTIHETSVRDIKYKLHTQEEKSRILCYKLQESNQKYKFLKSKFDAAVAKKGTKGNAYVINNKNN